MKTIPALTALILLASTPVFARVGETYGEVLKRYGKGEKQGTGRMHTTKGYYFIKDGFGIEVMILNGKSVMEVFHRKDGVISDAEIQDLLKANGETFTWAFESNQWMRSDHKICAFRQPGHGDFFFVQDVAATKQEPSPGKVKTDGF